MSEALIPPIYGEVLELRRHFRLLYGTQALNYLLATPAPTAAQLTAWLAVANTRRRRALGCAPTDRVAADRAAMLALGQADIR